MGWLSEVEGALGARPVRRIGERRGLRRAAVLVPLFVRAGSLWVLLTRRTDSMKLHAGALAFPGGSREAGDEDEIDTALREAEEEIGIQRERVVILGHLSDAVTTTGFVISPVVAAIPDSAELTGRSPEVEGLVPITVSQLLRPTLIEDRKVAVHGDALSQPVLHSGGQRISGATAAILIDLLERLSGGWPSEGPPAPNA